MWNPDLYRKFGAERDRPFFDLLSQVHAEDPRRVADLGCGPGNLTATLLERWGNARVTGVDSSREMLEKAGAHAVPGRLEFNHADLRDYRPDAPLDVLVSNATLQWVPEDHATIVPRLADLVAPGGWFAFQVPGNFDAPSHTILADLRSSPRWAGLVGENADRAGGVKAPEAYLAMLAPLGFAVNAWETTYLHVLSGEDAVLEWVKGTALRPVLNALNAEQQSEFLEAYGARLRDAYPRREFGTVLPFRRVFVVARRD